MRIRRVWGSSVQHSASPIYPRGSCCNTNVPAGTSVPRAERRERIAESAKERVARAHGRAPLHGYGRPKPEATRRPPESQTGCGVAGQGEEAKAHSRPAKAARDRAIRLATPGRRARFSPPRPAGGRAIDSLHASVSPFALWEVGFCLVDVDDVACGLQESYSQPMSLPAALFDFSACPAFVVWQLT